MEHFYPRGNVLMSLQVDICVFVFDIMFCDGER